MGATATYTFTVVLDRRPTDDELDTLLAKGHDDVTFGTEDGLPIAEFDREASSLTRAVVSGVLALESVGLAPLRILDEDLLTLADIADRIGQSRESVRRYVAGTRGPGGFPPPVNPGREGTLFYRWSEVAPWVRAQLGIAVEDNESALVAANLVLQARRHRKQVPNIAALSKLLRA